MSSEISHPSASSVDLGRLLEESGAIQKGHFVLSSGRHSDTYVEKFRVLERPDVLSALCGEIVGWLSGKSIDLVAGPTTGGVIIAFEIARQAGTPAIYVESVDGVKQIRRNAQIPPGARVLVVDDVLTTGGSLIEVAEAIRMAGGEVVAAAVLIDRSEVPLNLEYPIFAAYRVEAKSFPQDSLPEWLAKTPAVKPGTRRGGSSSPSG